MAKVKSEIREIFEGEGYLDATNIGVVTLLNDDKGVISISEILKNADGKFTKVVITTTEDVDVPIVDTKE